MSKLDVWMAPTNRIILSPSTSMPNGAIEQPEEWKLLGTLEMTDASELEN